MEEKNPRDKVESCLEPISKEGLSCDAKDVTEDVGKTSSEESLTAKEPSEGAREDNEHSAEECGSSDEAQTAEPEESYVPSDRYEAALLHVYKDETLSEMLRISSVVIVLLTVYAFFSRLALLFGDGKYVELIELLCITAVPFVIVSIMRKLINAPRPYEQLAFYRTPPKNKKGSSFPSRHVFSVFVIAAALAPYAPWLSVLLLALGATLGAFRVLLGIHYVRDVVAGALIGAVSGALGHLVFFLF